jgi:hypothetical protein
MNDPEVKAINEVIEAIKGLSDEQRHNVLQYVNTRYAVKPAAAPSQAAAEDTSQMNRGRYASMDELFDAANPQTEAERVLVVAYWIQVVEAREDFEAYPVAKHLKNLGHSVSNITRALDSLMAQKPRLIIQVSKSGNAKQARKRYKVTSEGIKRVKTMLDQQRNGGKDGN